MEPWIAGFWGLLIGSFLNVCIYRLPRDLSVVHPRSHCTNCERIVAWYDNIPVLSWILLRARCRHCGQSIHWQYPAVELATALLFFWAIASRGWSAEGLKMCVFSAMLVDLIMTDYNDRILPDEFTLGGFGAGVLLAAFTKPPSDLLLLFLPSTVPAWLHGVAEAALGGGLTAGLLWGAGALYQRIRGREGLGFGDVKLMLAIGAFLGLPATLMTIFFGSLLGAVAGSLYIWLAKKDMTYELPYGSFLGLAALAVGMFGDTLARFYWGLFN